MLFFSSALRLCLDHEFLEQFIEGKETIRKLEKDICLLNLMIFLFFTLSFSFPFPFPFPQIPQNHDLNAGLCLDHCSEVKEKRKGN